MSVVDAHQHFWNLSRGDYRFPRPDDAVLYKNFLPEDLAPLLARNGIEQTIVVQATDTIAETEYLLELASRTSFVGGVVGWWDPRAPDSLKAIAALARNDLLVGVRPMLQGVGDISFLAEPSALTQFEEIARRGLVFDALIDPTQIAAIAALVRRVPALQVVVDHMAKPWRLRAGHERWIDDMRELAQHENCAVKVSGYPFGTSGTGDRTVDTLLDVLSEAFGPGRLLWGSDWPVAEREGGYSMVLARMQALFSASERAAVFGENAARLYRLPRQRTGRTT